MHGRLKVRTTEEQKLKKQKEQQQKLAVYRNYMQEILASRYDDIDHRQAILKCGQLLSQNPDIYTLWNFRKEMVSQQLEKSKGDDGSDNTDLTNYLDEEIRITQDCLRVNPKSYGSWHHRYWILLHHPKPDWQNEFSLINKFLQLDDRNFHCWDYRRLIIKRIGITLAKELDFSIDFLNKNFSNYSSWHYRSTLRDLDENCIDNELSLVQNAVFTDPDDTSAWFYFRWVLSNNPSVTKSKKEELFNALEELQSLEPKCKWIVLAKCWLTGSLCLNDKDYIDKRVEYYKELIKLDPLRRGQYLDYIQISEKKIIIIRYIPYTKL